MASRLAGYHLLFGHYVRRYLTGMIPAEQRPMAVLKVLHSQRVRAEMKRLGSAIGLDPHSLCLAELSGLFHDIGRFEQLRKYGTFVDRESVNHAELSAKIVLEQGFFDKLASSDRRVVITAILLHNRMDVPPVRGWLESVLTLLLRDADKLDIWRVFNDHYSSRTGRDDSTLELNMPPATGLSLKVVNDIMEARIVDLSHVKNRNDFAMARLAWIFDINFVPALMEIKRRGYIAVLQKFLPDFPEKRMLFQRVIRYMDDIIAQNSPAC